MQPPPPSLQPWEGNRIKKSGPFITITPSPGCVCSQPACWWTLRLGIFPGHKPRLLRSPCLARAPLGLTVNELPQALHRRGFWDCTLTLVIWTTGLCQSVLEVTCSLSTSLLFSSVFPLVEESKCTQGCAYQVAQMLTRQMSLVQASPYLVVFLHHADKPPEGLGWTHFVLLFTEV